MWAEYSSSIARTTNHRASFHAHFNSNFNAAHPNIFVFMGNLLEIQCDIYAKILEFKQLKRKADTIQKEKTIATLMTHHDLGELDRLQCLQRVSFKFLPVYPKEKKA